MSPKTLKPVKVTFPVVIVLQIEVVENNLVYERRSRRTENARLRDHDPLLAATWWLGGDVSNEVWNYATTRSSFILYHEGDLLPQLLLLVPLLYSHWTSHATLTEVCST